MATCGAAAAAAALACGQAFTASGDGGTDASTQDAIGTNDAADGGARDGPGSPDGQFDAGPMCGPEDAAYNDCVYAYCRCLHEQGAREFFDMAWRCGCANSIDCKIACNATCPNTLPDSGPPCGNCLIAGSMVAGPCYYRSACADAGHPTECTAFFDCASMCHI
jgi:hypothetical protein